MELFGTPQRSAVTDANEGVVNPPAKRTVARTAVATKTKQLSVGDQAISTMTNNLGTALSGMLKEERNNIREEEMISAERRQGLDTAINSVDKVKKRTGWERAIFGENVEYRAAQQRAVENKVQATYLEQLAGVSGYAGDTPDQYYDRLREQNDGILSQYDDDPDTKARVAAALSTSTKKLSNAHYKEHYAYNQQQQQETTRTRLMQTLDGFNLERLNNIEPDEQADHLEDIRKFFDDTGKPDGMTPVAFRALKLEVLREHMTKGNVGAMKAAQAVGFDQGLSAGEQAQWDRALDAYDTQFSQKADLIRTTADIAIAEALTPAQVQVAVDAKEKQLGELFEQSSGTRKSQSVMARGNLDVAKNDASVIKATAKIEKALAEAQAKAIVDSDKAVIAEIGIELEDMRQVILNAETVGEKQEAINQYYEKLGDIGQDLSPAVAAILKREKLETDAAQAQQALDDELAKTRKVAAKKQKELDDAATKDAALAEYFQTGEPSRKAGLNNQYAFTKKEKEAGFDTHLLKGAQKFVGGDLPPTAEEFTVALQADPKLQTWVLGEMKRTGEVSPILKNVLTTATQSTDRLYDEDGNVNQVGYDTVQMVDKLLTSDKGVSLIGGKDAHRQWRITAIGVGSGSGKEAITKRTEGYLQNKGKADAAGFTWKAVIGKQSRRSWMTSKLQKLGVPNPSEQMITDYLYDYREDLIAFGYDQKEADNSMFQRLTNNKTKVFSSVLGDAEYLNEATKWTAEDFISTAEKHNMLTGKYADISGTNEVISSHRQIPNLRWYTKPGVEGLFASSPSANNEMFISVEEMKDLENNITQQEELQKAIDERRGDFAIKDFEETQRILEMTGKY